MRYRIGIDVGGTFTDLVLAAGARLWLDKHPPTPAALRRPRAARLRGPRRRAPRRAGGSPRAPPHEAPGRRVTRRRLPLLVRRPRARAAGARDRRRGAPRCHAVALARGHAVG